MIIVLLVKRYSSQLLNPDLPVGSSVLVSVSRLALHEITKCLESRGEKA